MSYEPWPSPDAPRGPLPRIEDLPVAEQGYDQEAVREAFDAFYRHAAQLDASLKALEAVEAFRRDAYELRNDLRALRNLGFGEPEPSWPASYAYERPRLEIPSAVPRIAAEAALLVVVAVICGVAGFAAWLIGVLMLLAWALVGLSEWLAARGRARFATAPVEEAALVAEQEAPASAPAGEALTVVEPPAAEPEPEPEPELPPEPVADAEPEPEPELPPEPIEEAEEEAAPPKRRWFRRSAEEPAEAEEEVPAPPSHVRVLTQEERDPWEEGAEENGARGPLEKLRRRRR